MVTFLLIIAGLWLFGTLLRGSDIKKAKAKADAEGAILII